MELRYDSLIYYDSPFAVYDGSSASGPAIDAADQLLSGVGHAGEVNRSVRFTT